MEKENKYLCAFLELVKETCEADIVTLKKEEKLKLIADCEEELERIRETKQKIVETGFKESELEAQLFKLLKNDLQEVVNDEEEIEMSVMSKLTLSGYGWYYVYAILNKEDGIEEKIKTILKKTA